MNIPVEINYTKNKNDIIKFNVKVEPHATVSSFMKDVEYFFNEYKHERSSIKRNYVLDNKFRFSYVTDVKSNNLLPLNKTRKNLKLSMEDFDNLKKVVVTRKKKKYVLSLNQENKSIKVNMTASNYNPMNAAKKIFNRVVDLHNLDENTLKKNKKEMTTKLLNLLELKKLVDEQYKFNNNELNFEISEYSNPNNQFNYTGSMRKLDKPYSILRMNKKLLEKKQITNLRKKHENLKNEVDSDSFKEFKNTLPVGANLISIRYDNKVRSV